MNKNQNNDFDLLNLDLGLLDNKPVNKTPPSDPTDFLQLL